MTPSTPAALRCLVRASGLTALLAFAGITALPDAGIAAPARHEAPQHYCSRIGNDDALRTPPSSFAPVLHRLFGIDGKYALATSYYRCAGGDLLVCTVGANLPCGKADTNKNLPAATRWCATHDNSDFIPMAVTGHDTPYAWRCAGGTAVAGAPTGKLDARGFFAENWKRAN